jgi:DNA invertase Pin-like site-specific DNA recombinase
VKVYGYARTSWAEQAQGGRHPSVAEQERALRDFCARTGVTLLDVKSDTAISPTWTTMEGVVSILDAATDGWDAVLVTTACRADHPQVSFDFREEVAANGKRILVADPATAVALERALKQAAASAPQAPEPAEPDEAEASKRRAIAERLLKGREAGARAGKHQSGPAPFGYRRDYDKRTDDGVLLVPDEQEGDVVRLIFREYLRLRSMKRLIKLLDEKGLRTRRGKRWSRAGVSWILKNDTYVGRVHFGSIRVRGRHTSLVPPILFNKVQKLIRENNKRGRDDLDEGDDLLDEVAIADEGDEAASESGRLVASASGDHARSA